MRRVLILILIVSTMLVACKDDESNLRNELDQVQSNLDNIQSKFDASDVDDLRQELDTMQEALDARKIALDKAEQMLEDQKNQIEESNVDLEALKSQLNKNMDFISFLELTDTELEAYNNFKLEFDHQVLKSLEPLSILKFYFVSSYKKDYDTQYELYVKDENSVMWTKEEDELIPKEHRLSDFDLFTHVYDIEVDIEDDQAMITWHALFGYSDEQGNWRYGFQLYREDDIWRVSFMPMQ